MSCNRQSSEYTVYKHTSPSGKVYVGITQQDPEIRWHSGHGYKRQQRFYNAIKKYGWQNITHEIIASGLTKEQAEAEEVRLIALYHSTDRGYGYNTENGGNSPDKVTDELRMRHRELKLGALNPCYGRKQTLAQKVALLDATRRKVVQVDANTGAVLREYASLQDAAFCVGTGYQSISGVCRGVKKTAGGFVWVYAEDAIPEVIKERLARVGVRPDCKAVAKVDPSTGDTVTIYPSMTAASRDNGTNDAKISECCRGKRKTAAGYAWRYAGESL